MMPASSIKNKQFTVFWFRRDLRLDDNTGLFYALKENKAVLPLFIFDEHILNELNNNDDKRVNFIYQSLLNLKHELEAKGSSLLVLFGKVEEVFEKLTADIDLNAVYTNRDYEPYARKRDEQVKNFLESKGIPFKTYKDQVIFEQDEVVKDNGDPYIVYTPYSKKWKSILTSGQAVISYAIDKQDKNFASVDALNFPAMEDIGFVEAPHGAPPAAFNREVIRKYDQTRDFPAIDGTSRLGVHFRFGTLSIRRAIKLALELNETWLNELIWREFYMQIIYHFPQVVNSEFRSKYRNIPWRYDEDDFTRWAMGQTGYPIVDAGMRELNETGYMHNRVRMITASFLTKHLLIDWRWGERYFAEKLLDYDLSANNGNWQWVAGTGVDAAPYFRVFNPETQARKFDPNRNYINKWIPELHSFNYPDPMIAHKEGRERYLKIMKSALNTAHVQGKNP